MGGGRGGQGGLGGTGSKRWTTAREDWENGRLRGHGTWKLAWGSRFAGSSSLLRYSAFYPISVLSIFLYVNKLLRFHFAISFDGNGVRQP